jgi:uncharacterized protein
MINRMNEKECLDVLTRVAVGRLGCAHDGQPYVVPIFFAHDGRAIYALSTLGKKIEWMRANPKVCLQADEIRSESDWTSVIVTGAFEELVEPQYTDDRDHARKLLEKRHRWWVNAMAERLMKSSGSLIEPLFFRIGIESISGLRATAE